MISVYRGIYAITPRGKLFKKYFIHIIKKLPLDLYFCKLYKKNTQYYNINAIKYLQKYVAVQIRKTMAFSNNQTTFFISSLDRLKHCKQTHLLRCNSKQDGSYIACPEYTLNYINQGITKFYKLDSDLNVAQIGYSSIYGR